MRDGGDDERTATAAIPAQNQSHATHNTAIPIPIKPKGHDPNDYEIGKRRGLETITIMNKDGSLNAAAGAYAGMDR